MFKYHLKLKKCINSCNQDRLYSKSIKKISLKFIKKKTFSLSLSSFKSKVNIEITMINGWLHIYQTFET